jgi:hypothetical protein
MGKINTILIQFSEFITSFSATTVFSDLIILDLNTYKLVSLDTNDVLRYLLNLNFGSFKTLFTLHGGQDQSDNIGWIPTFKYTETKKKLSPSLNVDMLVQFFNPFKTRFLR